jgi:hypothetical protein
MAFYVERLLSQDGRSEFHICDTDWGLPEEPATRVSGNFSSREAAELFVRDRRGAEAVTPRVSRWSSGIAQNSPTFVSRTATSALAISKARSTLEESRRDAKKGAILMASLLVLGIGYVVYALLRTYHLHRSY